MNYNNKVVPTFSDAIIYALITTISVFIVILKVAKTSASLTDTFLTTLRLPDETTQHYQHTQPNEHILHA